MTRINRNTTASDLADTATNTRLAAQGYTIRHIETWHRNNADSIIVWDNPAISEADLPY